MDRTASIYWTHKPRERGQRWLRAFVSSIWPLSGICCRPALLAALGSLDRVVFTHGQSSATVHRPRHFRCQWHAASPSLTVSESKCHLKGLLNTK